MKKNTKLTAIIGILLLIAWLIDQIRVEGLRVVLVEKGEATGAHETGNPNAPATSELAYPRIVSAG